jgi:hypothetical protein
MGAARLIVFVFHRVQLVRKLDSMVKNLPIELGVLFIRFSANGYDAKNKAG